MDFEHVIDRHHTDSMKWDMKKEYGQEPDAIALWVADMDFQVPSAVLEALQQRIDHGIFGYGMPPASYYDAVCRWMLNRHQWSVKKDDITIAPGVVPAINMAIQAFTKRSDTVLVQRPVYYPFFSAIEKNGRRLVNAPLVWQNNRHSIDFNAMEKVIREQDVKLFLLCSPHNPGGRVWTESELVKIADLCETYDVLVISDEIHHDLVFEPFKHRPIASLNKKIADRTVTLTSASKTFNIAGIGLANAIITNKTLQRAFNQKIERMGMTLVNTMAWVSCQAAYTNGDVWLRELLLTLVKNRDEVAETIFSNMPMIKAPKNEATYLMWLDFREFAKKVGDPGLFLSKKARLWLSDGAVFGPEGRGFFRLNIGCPHCLIQQAMERLMHAYQSCTPQTISELGRCEP